MEKVNVLVTGVGAPQGLSIMKAIRSSTIPVNIIGCDCNPMSVGLFRSNVGYVVPKATEDNFIDTIINICKKEKIDIIFSGTEKDMKIFSENKQRIEKEAGSFVLVSDTGVLDITMDKYKTIEWLQSQGFDAPRSALPEEKQKVDLLIKEKGFPIIMKPRLDSGGSKWLTEIYSEEELEFYTKKIPSPIIQENVGNNDEEFTIGVFVDNESKCTNVIVMKRWLSCGLTSKAIVDDYPTIREYVKGVAESLKPLGPCNFQLRLHDNKPTIFEINARFSSTTTMRWKFGFNEAEMAIKHFVRGEKIGKINIKKGIAFRYWDEVYVDNEEYERLISAKHISKPKSESYHNF